MKFINKEYLRQAILGLVVADALGVPFEFKGRDTFKVNKMVGNGTHNQPLGTWSDDSSMALATLDSFIKTDFIDYDDIMTRFLSWLDGKEYCPYGECFDIGNTTYGALSRFRRGTRALECGSNSFYENGNGSLMRILPIAFIEHTNDDIVKLSSLTHAHQISCDSCRLYIELVEKLMRGVSKYEAIKSLSQYSEKLERISQIEKLTRDEIKSSGYVIDSIEASIWCLIHTDSYKDCVITAVELGDDTDTVSAIAGGLGGILYGIGGEKGIPQEWIDCLASIEWIEEMIKRAIA